MMRGLFNTFLGRLLSAGGGGPQGLEEGPVDKLRLNRSLLSKRTPDKGEAHGRHVSEIFNGPARCQLLLQLALAVSGQGGGV
jgi:hypothetical protein